MFCIFKMSAKSLIICICVAISAASIAALPTAKDRKVGEIPGFVLLATGTKSLQGKQYGWNPSPVGYAQALSECNEAGGHLSQLETVGEKELIEFLLTIFPEITDIGLGGQCGSDQGRYEWDDSTQILTSVWGENNPNPIEPCQANHRVGGKVVGEKLQMYGFHLNEPKQYVCEIEL